MSHWCILVTENFHLVNAGAKLNGAFSSVEYQSRPSGSGLSSFRHLLARLPPRADSVYYRDDIGNISSSHLRGDSSKVLKGGFISTSVLDVLLLRRWSRS